MRFASLISIVAPAILVTLSACSSNNGGPGQTSDGTVSSLVVTPNPCGATKGGSQQMTAEATYANGNKLDVTKSGATWTSSNTSTATVDHDGNLVGVAGGTVTITASFDGVNGTAGCLIGP